MNFNQIFAIAKKEIKLNLRFKFDYLLTPLVTPLKFLVMFIVVYSGFFIAGAEKIGNVSKENYLSFLLLGSLTFFIFSSGFHLFMKKFYQEKYWRTIQALLIAPVDKINLIFGVSLSDFLRQLIVIIPFFIIGYLIFPTALINIFSIFLILILIYIGVTAFGLIAGVFRLTNENYLFLFHYFFWFWGFFSCFYYPIESLPVFIRPIVKLNPVYHGLYIIRELWINGAVDNFFYHFSILMFFVIFFIFFARFIFNKLVKKHGITGY